jgi:hypothetical protein
VSIDGDGVGSVIIGPKSAEVSVLISKAVVEPRVDDGILNPVL